MQPIESMYHNIAESYFAVSQYNDSLLVDIVEAHDVYLLGAGMAQCRTA